jgi:hypothetical protein
MHMWINEWQIKKVGGIPWRPTEENWAQDQEHLCLYQ